MPLSPSSKPTARATAVWLLFALLACIYFALSYNAHADYLNMADYTNGLSPTPYQYRVLPMLFFRELVTRPQIVRIAAHAPVEFRTPYQIAQLLLSLLAIVGAFFANYGTLKRLTSNDLRFSRWAGLLFLHMSYFTLVPGWGLNYTYPYDTPSLFFFALGIYLIVCDETWKTWAYYAVFPVAVLNRETAIFLTLFFVIWRWYSAKRPNPLTLALHAGAQFGIWIAIKHVLAVHYAANKAEGAITRGYLVAKFLFNLKGLVEPQQWPFLLSIGGFLLPLLWVWRREIHNRALSMCCAILVPLWAMGMMLVGVVLELRVFSELMAMLTPALTLAIYHRVYLPLQGKSAIPFARP